MKNNSGSNHGLVRRSKEWESAGRNENRRGKEKKQSFKTALVINAVFSALLTT